MTAAQATEAIMEFVNNFIVVGAIIIPIPIVVGGILLIKKLRAMSQEEY